MKRRTLRLDDLKTLAAVCHAYDAIDWPPRDEGGWAKATLNGHPYKARVEPEPVEELRAANLRILKHEVETPMRGHDEDGGCCRRARLGVTP